MKSGQLKRTIGLVSATSIGLGAMLGAGIFVFPGLAGGSAGFGAVFSFIIAGCIALLTALCTAELATAMPQSGGGYFFISRSFGPFMGTLIGIAQWIGLLFACAFYMASFGEYVLDLMEEFNMNWICTAAFFSFGFTIILLIINLLGTKKVGRFQNIMVISLTLMLVLLFTYGLVQVFGLKDQSSAVDELIPKGGLSIFTTTALLFTSYLGFVQIANIGAEIKNPRKNLPRSLIGSVLIAMLLYSFVMIVSTMTFTPQELKKYGESATVEVARDMLGNAGAIVVLIAALLATLSSANASMISASRSVFALGKDKVIHPSLSTINKRFGTPHWALLLVALPLCILLVRQQLEIFAEVASFLHLLIYAGICASVLKLRHKKPIWYIPTFRLPASTVLASLGVLSCLLLIGFMQKTSIFIGTGVVLIALAYYFIFARAKIPNLKDPKPPQVDRQYVNPGILVPVDISQESKDLPKAILESMPRSQLLLLGFKETPEQSEAEQSEEKYAEEAENKLKPILEELKKSNIDFDSELVFSHNIAAQIRKTIDDKDLQFILTLKPLASITRLVIPLYALEQVHMRLSTVIYNFKSKPPPEIRVLLFPQKGKDNPDETQLKHAIESQLDAVRCEVNDYKVYEDEKPTATNILEKVSSEEEVVIWSQSASTHRNEFLSIILDDASEMVTAPFIMILN